MIESYTRMLQNYMVFRGRTSRYAFWSFVLVQCAITIIALLLSGVVHDAVGILLALYLFATLMPTLGGIVRRLHDTGRGFWWLPLGVGLGPIAFVLGAVGFQFLSIGIVGLLIAVFVSLFGEDGQGLAEESGEFFEIGVAFFGLGLLLGIIAGVLAIILLVFLATPGDKGENKYGPQPEQ